MVIFIDFPDMLVYRRVIPNFRRFHHVSPIGQCLNDLRRSLQPAIAFLGFRQGGQGAGASRSSSWWNNVWGAMSWTYGQFMGMGTKPYKTKLKNAKTHDNPWILLDTDGWWDIVMNLLGDREASLNEKFDDSPVIFMVIFHVNLSERKSLFRSFGICYKLGLSQIIYHLKLLAEWRYSIQISWCSQRLNIAWKQVANTGLVTTSPSSLLSAASEAYSHCPTLEAPETARISQPVDPTTKIWLQPKFSCKHVDRSHNKFRFHHQQRLTRQPLSFYLVLIMQIYNSLPQTIASNGAPVLYLPRYNRIDRI